VPQRRFAVVAAAALARGCLVSGISGFFDGGSAADELAPGHVAFQVVLLGWTALVGVAAAVLTARLARRSPRTEAGSRAAG
jgi:hypothetical protein